MTEINPPRHHRGTYRHFRRGFALRLIFGPLVIAGIIGAIAYFNFGGGH